MGCKFRGASAAILLAALLATPAMARTIKIGVLGTYSGPNSNISDHVTKGMRLYIKTHQTSLPPDVRLDLIIRDVGGPEPAKAKRLAQTLIVRDKVQLLAGGQYTPNAAAIASLTAEARVPFIVTNAAGSALTRTSPYVARVSFTLWQVAYPLGQWAGKKYQRAYTLVSDFAPGHDAEEAFEKGFRENGGKIVGTVRTPLNTLDYAPFLQRVKDLKPDVLFAFVPAGHTAATLMKAYANLGLSKAGIKFVGTGDLTAEDVLPSMGNAAVGVITAFHYTESADRATNEKFVSAWKKEYGEASRPTFAAVQGWDGMDAIFDVIEETKGRFTGEQAMKILSHWRNPNSPRGPVHIDSNTRDIVQNVYLREVQKVDGRLTNVELETIGAAVRDPWKQFTKQKQ